MMVKVGILKIPRILDCVPDPQAARTLRLPSRSGTQYSPFFHPFGSVGLLIQESNQSGEKGIYPDPLLQPQRLLWLEQEHQYSSGSEVHER